MTAQRERLTEARKQLAFELTDLVRAAEKARGALESRAKRPPEPDMDAVHAAMGRVRDREDEVDMARADLATAAGDDL